MKCLALPPLALMLGLGISTPLSGAEAPPAITPAAAVELFNGRDFTGWEFFHRDNADPKTVWKIEDGVIKCAGKPNGYMRTTQGYKDYQVTVEWRFIKPGNTGVMVHMQLPERVWPRTVECQGAHDHQGDFWFQSGAKAKDRDGVAAQRHLPIKDPSNEKPLGEWNTFRVICEGANVKIVVNGKLMNEAAECDPQSGFIGLQRDGAERSGSRTLAGTS